MESLVQLAQGDSGRSITNIAAKQNDQGNLVTKSSRVCKEGRHLASRIPHSMYAQKLQAKSRQRSLVQVIEVWVSQGALGRYARLRVVRQKLLRWKKTVGVRTERL